MSTNAVLKETMTKMTDLGITEYQYFQEEGRVRWRTAEGDVAAHADCKAIMSFASTNNSWRWGLYPGSPTLDLPEWLKGKNMAFDTTEEETREVALKAALEAGAEYMFAGTMLTMTIYLSCTNVLFENDGSGDESAPWHPVQGDMSEHADLVMSIIDSLE